MSKPPSQSVGQFPLCHPAASGRAKTLQKNRRTSDDASQLLLLTARLHTTRGIAADWQELLQACRDGFHCPGVLDHLSKDAAIGPDELAALAGRISHCANFGDECGNDHLVDHQALNFKRQRCSALALHLHTASVAARKSLQAGLFDHLPPTWVLDRSGRQREANAGARELTRVGERFGLMEGLLVLADPIASRLLRKALLDTHHDTRFVWQERNDLETSLLLRPLPDGQHIAVTLVLDALGATAMAPLLASHHGLTPRQGDLAAHLLADHTLTGAARAMGISRHTANEHLAALLRQTGTPDRKSLLALLRHSVKQ
ncbi:MAG: helix-turn-helix transcriptional regulator [Rhodoferax sp.]